MNYELSRFIYSCKKFNLDFLILGMDSDWNGGFLLNNPGGFQKINLLKKELMKWKEEKIKNTIILFTDSYDVFFLSDKNNILNKYFEISKDKILFSAEKNLQIIV